MPIRPRFPPIVCFAQRLFTYRRDAIDDQPLSDLKSSPKHLRVKSNLSKQFNLFLPVQSSSKKFSVLPVGQITITESRRPASQEGRFAIVTDVERGMRWTRGSAADERAAPADGEAVWS